MRGGIDPRAIPRIGAPAARHSPASARSYFQAVPVGRRVPTWTPDPSSIEEPARIAGEADYSNLRSRGSRVSPFPDCCAAVIAGRTNGTSLWQSAVAALYHLFLSLGNPTTSEAGHPALGRRRADGEHAESIVVRMGGTEYYEEIHS